MTFGKVKIAVLVFLVVAIAGCTWFFATYPMVDGDDGTRLTKSAEIVVQHSFTVPLEAFRLHVGRFPTTEEGLAALVRPPPNTEKRWRGPYVQGAEIPRDPWGHEYRYRYPGAKNAGIYDLWSLGPDGVPSEDDIWNREK